MLAGLKRFTADELVRPAASRAFRATAAFMVPLVLAACGQITGLQALLAGFAGHAIAGLEIRGAYGLRITLFLGLSFVFAGAAWLGASTSASVGLAVAATGLIALASGFWRHVLGEYGFSVGASSALLFFIALASPPAPALARTAWVATLAGSLGGLALHALLWPFMAEHPLRRTVAGSWLALADLAAALAPEAGTAGRHARVAAGEQQMRTTLDQAAQALAAARNRRTRPFIGAMEGLNLAAAQLATQVLALDPILEGLGAAPERAALAASARSVLASLVNCTRSVALAVVSHQPAHLARFEVRLRRATHLLRVLRRRAAAQLGDSPEGSHLAEVVRLMLEHLPRIDAALRASMERAQERGPISYELFDLQTWTLRPLASALNFTLRPDPALVRFSLRIAVIMMAGAGAWRLWQLPHGYWIPLCVMVVLQPDYGATRARATQRTLGTLAGSLTASLMLWLHLPPGLLLAATACTVWAFTFNLKRDYGVAVFWITLLVVLQMEATGPVTMALTLQRLGLTAAGCFLAVLAALVFWPVWEKDRLPPLLAEALRANRTFLDQLCAHLEAPGAGWKATLLPAKFAVQRANSMVISSLNRLAGDPKVLQEGLAAEAALANGNLRITRWLSAAAVHLEQQAPAIAGLDSFNGSAGLAFEALAAAVETGALEALPEAQAGLEAAPPPAQNESRAAWVVSQLELAGTELSAMLSQKSQN